MNEASYKNFLHDVVNEILEKFENNTFEENTDLYHGYRFAIYEVISILIEQSEIFHLDKSEIGLKNVNPEKDFLI